MSDLDLGAAGARANAAQSRNFQSIDTRLRTTRGSAYALLVMKDAADTIDALSIDVVALVAEVRRLSQRPTVEDIRSLHRPVDIEPSSTVCGECSWRLPNGRYFGKVVEWPCPTVALFPTMEGGDDRG